jgi:hypothetical protein
MVVEWSDCSEAGNWELILTPLTCEFLQDTSTRDEAGSLASVWLNHPWLAGRLLAAFLIPPGRRRGRNLAGEINT